ncbi:hypothetical protein BGZ60DRAFT_404357 [Tricladium varicosporioides]|nr:hypothetical protein BGZ60DRAFT_404357 [Hymenoscyphus varicosporioides]
MVFLSTCCEAALAILSISALVTPALSQTVTGTTLGSASTSTYAVPYAITTLPAFSTQKPCLQTCFMNNIVNEASKLPGYVHCPFKNEQYDSTCVCQATLAQSASTFLIGCVSLACGSNMDVDSALGIYEDYCGRTSTRAAVQAQGGATVTGPGSGVTTTIVVSVGGSSTGGVTGTPTNLQNSSPSASSSSVPTTTNGMNTAVIAGIIALAVVSILSLAGVIFLLCRRQKTKELEKSSQPQGEARMDPLATGEFKYESEIAPMRRQGPGLSPAYPPIEMAHRTRGGEIGTGPVYEFAAPIYEADSGRRF